MSVSLEDVKRIARLAKLEYDDAELARFVHHFQQILSHFETLGKADTEGVSPTYHALDGLSATPMRADEVRPSLPSGSATENAPQATNTHFRVPRVIE